MSYVILITLRMCLILVTHLSLTPLLILLSSATSAVDISTEVKCGIRFPLKVDLSYLSSFPRI